MIRQIGRKLRDDEAGTAMTEYGLVLALIAVASVAALSAVGGDIRDWLQGLASALPAGN